MNNLVIDIGNTFTKIALFDGPELQEVETTSKLDRHAIADFIKGRTITSAILSAVKDVPQETEEYLRANFNYQRFSTTVLTPVKLQYKTPETLGLDRFAAVIGASALFEGHNILVIDAGTCITYDFVDETKNYFGGSISPGLNMRFKAMNAFTGKLPLTGPDAGFKEAKGYDTLTSMRSGVQNGVLHEIKGFISDYKSFYPDLMILLCGGDANYFDTQLKNSIFAPDIKTIPDLVLIGLNEVILQQK